MAAIIIGHSQIKYLREYLKDKEIATLSFPGYKVQDTFAEVRDAIPFFDIIGLHLGANDITTRDGTFRYAPEEIVDHVMLLVTAIKSIHPTSKIILSQILPRGQDNFPGGWKPWAFLDRVNEVAHNVNGRLDRLFSGREDVSIVKHPNFHSFNGPKRHLLSKDGLHLSYTEMATPDGQFHDANPEISEFWCTMCSKDLSSKKRLTDHIENRHPGPSIAGPKEECYTILDLPSGTKYRCDICLKALASKQRILSHLEKVHLKSPVRAIKGQWKHDPSTSIPRSTKWRLQKSVTPSSVEALSTCAPITPTSHVETDVISYDIGKPSYEISEIVDQDFGSESDTSISSVRVQSHSGMSSSASATSLESSASIQGSSNEEDLGLDHDPELFSTSTVQAYCKTAYALRHNLSRDADKDLSHLLKICCPDQQFDFPYEEVNYTTMNYCVACDAMFPINPDIYTCSTEGCHGLRYNGGLFYQTKVDRQPKASFVLADVKHQLKHLLEKKTIWESVQMIKQSANHPVDSIKDLTDGSCYRHYCNPGQFLHHNTHLSAIFNTDGVPLYSSSKVKLWPIFLAINELPVSLRFARENILVAGIWQGKGNPPFFQFLQAFALQMNDLKENGILIQPAKSHPLTVKLAVICATLDLQAKAYVSNMTMHNGECGCCLCEETGIVVPQGRGHARCYPYRAAGQKPVERDADDIRVNIAPQATRAHRQKGICGQSGVSAMPYFNIVDGFVPDYMHGVLLGTTKSLMYLWFSPTNANKPFFIGRDLATVSKRLQGICPPDYIERLPRDLEKNYNNFKATELQSWLLFYSLPCLKDILPEPYFRHLGSLSQAVYILLSDSITETDLAQSEDLLDEFYSDFSELYGDGPCGLNVHNIGSHLVSTVRKWGPLWAWSCFPFEDANAAILDAVHGTGDVIKQYLHFKNLEGILSNIDFSRCPSTEMKRFLRKMLKQDRAWASTKAMTNCSVAGALFSLQEQAVDENLLISTVARSFRELKKVLRVEVNGRKLYSQQYSRMKKRICYVVCTNIGGLLKILYFVVNTVTKMVFAVGQKVSLVDECLINDRYVHIFKVCSSPEIEVVDVTTISEKVFFISVENNYYACRMPNLLGHAIFK